MTAFLSFILIIGLTGCSKNKLDIGDKSDIEISNSDVVMSLKEDTLTDTGATIILTNNSDKNYTYGNPYEIEIKKDGEWHKINVLIDFTLPAFPLKPGEAKEIKIGWKDGYGKLPTGNYRIIKRVSTEEDGKSKTFNIALEFNIDSD